MAQILPEEMTSLSNLSPSSKTVYRILEQNLSDEWECHAALSGNNIVRFLITSPDLGVLVLCISNCSPDQFDSFSSDIPQLKQQYLDTVRQHLQKEYQLCNDDKSLKFPIGFGLIFTELSSDYANSATIGILSEFVLFNDELQDMTNSDTELEDRLFDMVEEFDFNELDDDDELQIISDNIPSIHVALQKVKMEIGEIPEKQIDDQPRLWCSLDKETDEVEEKQSDLKRWWNFLDDEWKNIFMAHIGDEPLRNLKSLKKLSISDTQVSDLEPLRNLKSLEKLSMFLTGVPQWRSPEDWECVLSTIRTSIFSNQNCELSLDDSGDFLLTYLDGDRHGIKKKLAKMFKQRKDAGLNQVSWWGNRGVQIEVKNQYVF